WVDTCCIDKSSSAELSEAIDSIFNWYQKATLCFAFLEDIALLPPVTKTRRMKLSPHHCLTPPLARRPTRVL
ncbi:hypothetical protein B0T14DRAFT_419433, partial [Immersiella caudata]